MGEAGNGASQNDRHSIGEDTSLRKETNWLGAFVIGLAGTILVTGIAPAIVTTMGASCLPVTLFITLTGWLVCLILAELSAMMPHRTGGLPSYAYPAYSERWPRFAKHISGISTWMYWIGWFPVAPLNMILASFYISDRIGMDITTGFTPISTFIAYSTLGIAFAGILALFIPAYLGIRFGSVFAGILAILSMVPLTFLAVAWLFNLDVVNWQEIAGFRHLDGSSFFAPLDGYNWLTAYLAYCFLLTWNVIAMEAAACYIGECTHPDRDAKIAMNLEGGYGSFIYVMIPLGFIVVLGAKALQNPDLVDPKSMFVTFAGRIFGAGGEWLNWAIAIMLIIALMLSALNAIMGCARGLYQMSVDGQFPRWFAKVNKHGVPSNAMFTNVVASLIVVLMGGAVEIYSFSNVGYVGSFVPVLIGYHLLRNDHPEWRRPYRLPEFMKYVSTGIAILYFIIWSYGGYMYSQLGNVRVYYFLGWVAVFLYLPLYWYRTRVEDPKYGTTVVEDVLSE